jgi:hypothetical protein
MEWIPKERRKRGCPRKMWMKGVQAAITARNLEQDQWRNGGMAFGFRKMATAVIKPDRLIEHEFNSRGKTVFRDFPL